MAGPEGGDALPPVLKNQMRSARTALWVRPGIFSVAAALAVVLLAAIDGLLPPHSLAWLPEVGAGTVNSLLELLASGMLTVATVTLSVQMLVLNLAAAQVSPRAVPEIMADQVTQNAMATFLATFVYALSALLLIGFGAIAGVGITLVFLGALLVMLNAVRYLVQWIHHVANTLKINHTIHRVHRQAQSVLDAYFSDEGPHDRDPVGTFAGAPLVLHSATTGYVELIDSGRLHRLACDHDLALRLLVQEGDFVHPRRPLMKVRGARPDAATEEGLRAAVVLGFERTHEGDPRLGFEVLAEIASRALSPAINDPQSAVACVNYLGSLLAKAASHAPERYPAEQAADGRVRYLRADFAAFLERAFRPIMRDGARFAEVLGEILRTQQDLAESAAHDYLDSIAGEARRVAEFAESSLDLEIDREAIRRNAEALRQIIARRRSAAGDDPDRVDDPGNVAEDRQQDVQPEVKAEPNLQKHAERRQ